MEKLLRWKPTCVIFCENKIVKKYFKINKSNVKKILKSLEEESPIDEDKSLEELL